MIIFGTKAAHLKTEAILDRCPNCGAQNTVSMSIFQEYGHVYWIPFFPTRKIGATQCAHCGQVLKEFQFIPPFRETCNAIKSELKAPVWTFSGIALVVVLFVVGAIVFQRKMGENARLIAAPLQGDIYQIKKNEHAYTLYKVDHIAADTIFLLTNKFESNKRSGLYDLKLKADDAFDTEPFPVLNTALKIMLDKGEIIGVNR